jgi:hypothetical protein
MGKPYKRRFKKYEKNNWTKCIQDRVQCREVGEKVKTCKNLERPLKQKKKP